MSISPIHPSDIECRSEWIELLERDGFAVIPRVYSLGHVERMNAAVASALADVNEDGVSIRSQQGAVVGARNVLDWLPDARSVWNVSPLKALLLAVLGPDFGLVRALYFDKPPERSWSLPWHQDLTVAVRDNQLPSDVFTKPTRKAGVGHVEAPVPLLEAMLILRVFLDDVTELNGPLRVQPGTHRQGKHLDVNPSETVTILGDAGDVLAIRPLVAHTSGHSSPECDSHRRTLHLEFAESPILPDPFEWHAFIPGRS